MDKKSITGLVLIFAILVGFYLLNKPSEADKLRWQEYHDSLSRVEAARLDSLKAVDQAKQLATADTLAAADSSAVADAKTAKYGQFASYIDGEQAFTVIENNLMKLTITNKGARIYSVELKNFDTFDGKPVTLFNGDKNEFGFTFVHNNRAFNTNNLYFQAAQAQQTDSSANQSFQIATGNGALTYKYALVNDSYLVNFSVESQGLENQVYVNNGSIDINWTMEMRPQEKARKLELANSGIFYRYHQADVEELGADGTKEEDVRQKVDWIAFKGQYFSSIFINNQSFNGANVQSAAYLETDTLLRKVSAKVGIPFNFASDKAEFNFYFGPNKYYTLNSLGEGEYTSLIPLGWGIFGWINRWVIIPVFNFLESRIASYGIIILLLTLLIKLVLFPFTYKSYKSSAKMKVLRPQIEEINAKIPADKAMERQQATMNLYKKAGVSPLGGCLPMLLQMPILLAAFRFFPAAFELRQKSFLWADDLSTYDSICTLPFDIPFYGDHVSLFCLLMSVTNLIYTRMNAEMTQSTQQMPGMKFMMYMMPVMFLFFFNSYSAGLSYYYFISTLFTVVQTIVIRKFFIDEEAILAKLKANQKKPVNKSKWAQRLEEMAKAQQTRKK